MSALPTRRDEAWRYSDMAALAAVWPIAAPERIVVAPGGDEVRRLIADGSGVPVREFAVDIGAGGRFAIQLVIAGSALGRVTLDVTVRAGADFQLDCALLAAEGQTIELVTIVRHVEPDATSRQTVRGIAGARGTVNYLGKVAVSRPAQKTDASQSAKAMLLTRTATANLKPELEIYADDVKCAHGATVGELDAGALFYLASRGLPPADAKALLLRAFVGGLFDALPEAERADFDRAVGAALETIL